MYELNSASKSNVPLLVYYKLTTIFEYSGNIDEEEKNKILTYVNNMVPKLLDDYKIIVKENVIIGCVLITAFRDGILLDEIYLEEDYRNFGIGSNIIRNLLNRNAIIYLWYIRQMKKLLNFTRNLIL